MLEKITPRYQALIVLLIWGTVLITAGLVRFDAYGIDEAATRALLLVWSVVDRVINPIFILGLPDLRALLFAPVGLYWSGSIIAVKVFTGLITFTATLFFYRWIQGHNKETALIATGLLLIAPLTLTQINSIAAGPFLLLGFGFALWLSETHRRSLRPFGGWFFLQLLLIIVLTSIHPIALAYPLALLIEWYKNPGEKQQQQQIYIGIGIATLFTLLIRGGWDDLTWFNNPLTTLSSVLLGEANTGSTGLIIGTIVALLLAVILIINRQRLLQDLLGRTLTLAIIIGTFCADQSWAYIGLALLLYIGGSNLVALNSKIGGQSFIGQRGLIMVVLLSLAITFMQGIKIEQQRVQQGTLSPHDFLIQNLALKLEGVDDDDIMIMSQWPGRTMLATRRPAIPLPPIYPDSETLLTNIKGVTHIIFDPLSPNNNILRDHLARLTSVSETLALEQGGVIVLINTLGSTAPRNDTHSANIK